MRYLMNLSSTGRPRRSDRLFLKFLLLLTLGTVSLFAAGAMRSVIGSAAGAFAGSAEKRGVFNASPLTNKITAENALPGNPANEWGVSGAGDANIQGFATDISVNAGETVDFKIDTNSPDYRLDIYRMGY
jgi:hypothetical protein